MKGAPTLRNRFVIGSIVSLALTLSACERGIEFRVNGTPNHIIFEMKGFPAFGFIRGPQPAIDSLDVVEYSSGHYERIWSIARHPDCAPLVAIRYGTAPSAFYELVAAHPLVENTLYSVSASGCGFFGGAYFKIDRGHIIQVQGTGDQPRRQIEAMSK